MDETHACSRHMRRAPAALKLVSSKFSKAGSAAGQPPLACSCNGKLAHQSPDIKGEIGGIDHRRIFFVLVGKL